MGDYVCQQSLDFRLRYLLTPRSCETTSIGRKIKGAPIVLVVVLVLDKILILEDEHEDEDEK